MLILAPTNQHLSDLEELYGNNNENMSMLMVIVVVMMIAQITIMRSRYPIHFIALHMARKRNIKMMSPVVLNNLEFCVYSCTYITTKIINPHNKENNNT